MPNDFCTLFDRNYLARALVLYRSLERTGASFRLRALCMDDESERIVERLALPWLDAVPLRELEAHDPGLASVRSTRDPVEYCWTATPALCLHLLEREPGLGAITYLDADLFFYRDPAEVFAEDPHAAVILVPHRYAPEHAALEPLSGTYNVQFMTFQKDDDGLAALRWWHERCIEWCFRRHEDGKFGDQKYLDDWPERFRRVHVAESPGIGLAPWNVARYRLERVGDDVLVDGRPLVFYHCHALRLLSGVGAARRMGLLSRTYRLTRGPVPLVWQTAYPVAPEELALVWQPYVAALSAAMAEIRRVAPGFSAGLVPVPRRDVPVAAIRELVPAPVRHALRRAGRRRGRSAAA